METEDDEAKELFGASSVSSDTYESHVDAIISSVFVADDNFISENEHANDVDGLSRALSLRKEISKFAANIGSCTISDNNCSLFATEIDSIHDTISRLIHPDSLHEMQCSVSSLNAGKPVGVDPTTLSKLWLISEPLTQGLSKEKKQTLVTNMHHLSKAYILQHPQTI